MSGDRDSEALAIEQIAKAMEPLDVIQRRRVCAYLRERYEFNSHSALDPDTLPRYMEAVKAAAHSIGLENGAALLQAALRLKRLGELEDAEQASGASESDGQP